MSKRKTASGGSRWVAMAQASLPAMLVAIALTTPSSPAQADYTVRVNRFEDRGTWEGFGASLSWWANGVGRSSYESTYSDLFWTLKPVTFNGTILPGLGMNIARYNIGGGGLPSDNLGGAVDRMPSTVPWYKDIDGYWRDWINTDPASTSWDWSRDANQRSVMAAANARGVTFEFFANAPMWWMTSEKSSAGGRLQAWNRRDHARHLATVVQRAQGQWGIKVGSLEAFNEPSAVWWKYPVGQEGANIPVDVQKEVLGYLREELNARGLRDVSISASDENSMSQALASHEYLKGQTVTVGGTATPAASLMGQLNVHGYNGLDPWRDDSVRQRLRASAGNKRIWMSEYGDGEGSGLTLAQSIMADLTYLRPSAWVYWQPVEPYSSWGLVNGKYSDAADATAADRGKPLWIYTKYYVYAQFTRFLRPGYKIIGSSDAKSVVAHDSNSNRLVLITLNEGPAQTITYDLSGLAALSQKNAAVTTTSFDGSKTLSMQPVSVTGTQLSVAAPANSVQSVVLDGVVLGAVGGAIKSASSGMCADVFKALTAPGTQVVQWDCNGQTNQQWLPAQDGAYFSFKIGHTGQCLEVNGASLAAGAALIQGACGGMPNEQFMLKPQGLGYAMVARHSGLCVGLENGSSAPETRLTQQACSGSPSQTWFVPLGEMQRLAGSYQCLTLPGASVKQIGTPADQWTCVGSTNQQWKFAPVGADVQISSVNSGLCLGVADGSLAAGALVVQSTCADQTGQRFWRKPQGGGFAWVARHSGMCLTPENSSQALGARIVQQPCNGSANQTWR